MIEVTPELLARHDHRVPRYTSYPTALEFTEEFGAADHGERLSALAERPDTPLSLYVHLPFCDARCSFCACHVVVARRPEVSAAYVRRLLAEASIVAGLIGGRRSVVGYHWGGGTPTHYPPDTLREIHTSLTRVFPPADGAEASIEVDPRVTTPDHVAALAEMGFNRLSLGVQDLDPEVQRLIGRGQTAAETVELYRQARRAGFASINFDLVYGLPGQDPATMMRTLDGVLALRPDRFAVYSFAYVPWMRPHQRRIDEGTLPSTEAKFELAALVINRLTAAGYEHIGMDHFALPDDELSSAARAGTLGRNFMGYTTRRDTPVLALGASGISAVDGAYAQNHRRLASYYSDVESGTLPVERGYRLRNDDLLRRHVIDQLMCNGSVDLEEAAARHGGAATFETELTELGAPGGLVDEGLAEIDGATVRATELGRLFVRRIAAVFDVYSRRRIGDSPAFSRSV